MLLLPELILLDELSVIEPPQRRISQVVIGLTQQLELASRFRGRQRRGVGMHRLTETSKGATQGLSVDPALDSKPFLIGRGRHHVLFEPNHEGAL